jgi:hypothetical protein
MKNKKYAFIVLISILILSTLACNFGLKNGNITTTITLKKDNLMQIINTTQEIAGTVSETDLLIEVQDIEFIEPDKIWLTGFYGTPNSERVNGEIEIAFSVENDKPKVEITTVNIPGVDLASGVIKDLNEKLSGLLSDQIALSGENALIKTIIVTNDAVIIDVAIPLRK